MTNILPNAILRKKRFGGELNEAEIRAFVRGVTDKTWADYQISALLMAICIHGMSDRETLALTLAMAKSGDTLDLKDIPRRQGRQALYRRRGRHHQPHPRAPDGRLRPQGGEDVRPRAGLYRRHAGQARVHPRHARGSGRRRVQVHRPFRRLRHRRPDRRTGPGGQGALRPARRHRDGGLLPLVVSSILSKKLASGCDVVVLDVKTGSGAIMDTPEKSRKLAEDMVRIGNLSGRRFSALITDMDQPLGMYIGNALEVEEAIDVLAGRTAGPLRDVALTLGAHMLRNAGLAPTVEAGKAMLAEKIENGAGLAKFAEMIRAQGGDPRVCEDTGLLPKAGRKIAMPAPDDGYISSIRTCEVGNAARLLGAGRLRKEDAIDPAVGIVMQRRVGEYVRRGDALLTIHANAHSDVAGALNHAWQGLQALARLGHAAGIDPCGGGIASWAA